MRRKVFSVQHKRPLIFPFMAQRTVVDDGDERYEVVSTRRWFSKGRNVVVYQTK